MAKAKIPRIAVVTGSRAEFGILRWVIQDIDDDPGLDLALVVTGSHLSERHGLTVREIETTGVNIAAKVPLDLSGDDPASISKAMGTCVTGMSIELQRLAPDILLVLGDRYEIFASVQAAMMLRIPVAHIAGGDVTEGAIDEAMRHSITKMSHVHFATNVASARRLEQMGEDPARIFVTGSPALDHLRRDARATRNELEQKLGAQLGIKNMLVTFHPVTLATDSGLSELDAMLAALEQFSPDTQIWITRSNADSGGTAINQRIEEWATDRDNANVYTSLGIANYMSLMSVCDIVIGNSSSGLYEAPSFGIPTVNIGERQGGRLSANSVFHCVGTPLAVQDALVKAENFDRRTAINPYGDGYSAQRIVGALKAIDNYGGLLLKRFHDLARPLK
jgi:UDP-hydrolysing UDP-N-acetyl-D-glucosamine 2-epimerase